MDPFWAGKGDGTLYSLDPAEEPQTGRDAPVHIHVFACQACTGMLCVSETKRMEGKAAVHCCHIDGRVGAGSGGGGPPPSEGLGVVDGGDEAEFATVLGGG